MTVTGHQNQSKTYCYVALVLYHNYFKPSSSTLHASKRKEKKKKKKKGRGGGEGHRNRKQCCFVYMLSISFNLSCLASRGQRIC